MLTKGLAASFHFQKHPSIKVSMVEKDLKDLRDHWVSGLVECTVQRLDSNNLFVPSKNKTTNSPIHEFKVLHKGQRTF